MPGQTNELEITYQNLLLCCIFSAAEVYQIAKKGLLDYTASFLLAYKPIPRILKRQSSPR